MTINNAYEARELAKNSEDPKLQRTLEQIHAAAGEGLYIITIDRVSQKLFNNLKSRGFGVTNYDNRSTLSW